MVKGKRWKKGQSSSSNPKFRKYRTAASLINPFIAKSDTANGSSVKSQLTKEALDRLESTSAIVKQAIDVDEDDDNQTVDTFKSWASNWSNCTNATFNKVHKYWKSNSALHKEVWHDPNALILKNS
jgi:ribosomal RNA-processing protein 12